MLKVDQRPFQRRCAAALRGGGGPTLFSGRLEPAASSALSRALVTPRVKGVGSGPEWWKDMK